MYYTLAIRIDGQWSAEFGDFDRRTVKDERDHARSEFKAKDLRIIKHAPTHEATLAAIAELNA